MHRVLQLRREAAMSENNQNMESVYLLNMLQTHTHRWNNDRSIIEYMRVFSFVSNFINSHSNRSSLLPLLLSIYYFKQLTNRKVS